MPSAGGPQGGPPSEALSAAAFVAAAATATATATAAVMGMHERPGNPQMGGGYPSSHSLQEVWLASPISSCL